MALIELTVNPLLLTMIAMVHRYRGVLPGSRVALYSEIAEVLLGRWRQAMGLGDQDKLTTAQKLYLIRPLAVSMMNQRIREVTSEEANRVLAPFFAKSPIPTEERSVFLHNLQASSGLVLEREHGSWTFAHLTFQEYFTAAEWRETRSAPEDWSSYVRDSWWHETIRLYAAQSDASTIVAACLRDGSADALALASDCVNDAAALDPQLKRETNERIDVNLQHDDVDRRRSATEARLRRRIMNFKILSERLSLDDEVVTNAEYELFIYKSYEKDLNLAPEHWGQNISLPGFFITPATGVSERQAIAFTEWLTTDFGGFGKFRLPTLEEAIHHPIRRDYMCEWTITDGTAQLAPPSSKLLEQVSRAACAYIGRSDLTFTELPSFGHIAALKTITSTADNIVQWRFGEALSRKGMSVVSAPEGMPSRLLLSQVLVNLLSLESQTNAGTPAAVAPLKGAMDLLFNGMMSSLRVTIDNNYSRNQPLHPSLNVPLAQELINVAELIRDLRYDDALERIEVLCIDEHPPTACIMQILAALSAVDAETSIEGIKWASRRAAIQLLCLLHDSYEEYIIRGERVMEATAFSRNVQPVDLAKGKQVTAMAVYWLAAICGREERRVPAWEVIRLARERIIIPM